MKTSCRDDRADNPTKAALVDSARRQCILCPLVCYVLRWWGGWEVAKINNGHNDMSMTAGRRQQPQFCETEARWRSTGH